MTLPGLLWMLNLTNIFPMSDQMRKRKRLTDREKRQKDKERKREKRQQSFPSFDIPGDNTVPDCDVPHGSTDGEMSAPPDTFPGHGFNGLPPVEGKPMARMQASPSEKMHPNALSNASSQGSRLCARNGGMAPSPDSPPWVCTSPRVPEPDTVHVSGSAGQAQLDMSSSQGDESSRSQIDAMDIKTDFQTDTETILNEYIDIENEKDETMNAKLDTETEIYDFEDKNGIQYSPVIFNDEIDTSNTRSSKTFRVCVQGSFHQGDIIFGENAGTQCVANSLAALSYHKLKNSKYWEETDMDKVLATGDELYTYLQRSSTAISRYLLVHELPQFFECFSKLFEFKANESLASLINLLDVEPCYEDFNAFSLLDALHIALGDTDGCFVCFGGSTFLVGKIGDEFFTFDSHSRSCRGHMSINGRSTRVLYQSVQDIYSHVLSLAVSMGYAGLVNCEITGVHCTLRQFEGKEETIYGEQNYLKGKEKTVSNETLSEENISLSKNSSLNLNENGVEIVLIENHKLSFVPLSRKTKQQLCNVVRIPCSSPTGRDEQVCLVQEIEAPLSCEEIKRDGNCFFRAVSFCLTGVEKYHYEIRLAVCQHLLQNRMLFQPFLRATENSVERHISSTSMLNIGIWATEIEILALSHLLSTDIHTYSQNRWITYSGQMVDQKRNSQPKESIYLYHENQNHYNVVLTISGRSSEAICRSTSLHIGNKNETKRELSEMHYSVPSVESQIFCEDAPSHEKKVGKLQKNKSRAILRKLERAKQKYKSDLKFRVKTIAERKKRYKNDEMYRTKLKRQSVEKYALDANHRMRVQENSKKKYRLNEGYRKNMKSRSTEKYKSDVLHRKDVNERSMKRYLTNDVYKRKVKIRSIQEYKKNRVHRENVMRRSIEKYKIDQVHRQNVKQRSSKKYKMDGEHRENVKQRSKEKYQMDEEHRENAKQRSTEKYKMDEEHRENVKQRSIKKYKKDEVHRENVKKRSTEKYKTDEAHNRMVKASSKLKYHFSSDAKKEKKEYVRNQRQALKVKLEDEDEVVELFKENARKGPEFTCCCCHRLLFENQVQGCAPEMYEKSQQAREVAQTCIQNNYVHQCIESCSLNCPKVSLCICFTCHRKILSGKIPAEAAANKMYLEEIPFQLGNLNSLEQHLIALHIPFMKVMGLPQGGQRNVHGPVVCVPSSLKKTTSLPLNADENLLLRVKLKRKLTYKGYFEYQFVNPNHVKTALNYLKKNNRWYKDAVINTAWEEDCEQSDLIADDSIEFTDEGPNEENEVLEVVMDTCLQPVDVAQEVLDHYFDDVYNIAPGEGKNPIRMLQEEGNEAKTFPHLFPSGNFSWNEERDVKISLSKYFNNRLMNVDNRFARDTNYIFFSQYMSELNQVIEKTQISIRKSVSKLDGGKTVTSDMLQNPDVLSKLLKNDEALRFMQPIRGTPAYWSAAQKDLFAMLRQLGIPTWFCSFSVAEFRWNEIIGCILRHQNDDRHPDNLDWSEKSELLRSNPVSVARMFEHRFHVFQRDVILSPAQPIGKVIDYFVRVEFQQRGSPHMHCLYWVENAPKFDEDDEDTICAFIDKYITCSLPVEIDNTELRKTVIGVQQHSKNHSKSCRKKGTDCRFNFPRPPSERTFIVRKCAEEDDDSQDDERMCNSQAKDILLSVWNEVLDEKSALRSTEEVFSNIQLSQDLYEMAHRILSSRTCTILKRNPDEMWTNQYNPCLLKCWDANMDIQFVLDPFSCIVYIISYISKSEREMGMLLKQTQIEAAEGNLSARQTLKSIGSAYLNHREVSAQEAVYRVCNLKMKESSRKVVFIPVGENPTRLSKPLAQMKKNVKSEVNDDEMDDDEDSIWLTNIVERYENRPDLELFNDMCLAEFCSEFRVLSKSQIPQTEKEGVYQLNHAKGYIQRRTRSKPAVVRYPRFNPENAPEKYYQAILQLFLPYYTQYQLKPPGFHLYQSFYESGHIKLKNKSLQAVKVVVDSNRSKFSKNEDAIENAQETLELFGEPEDAWAKLCPETEVRREECLEEKKKRGEEENKEMLLTEEFENDSVSDLYHIKDISNSRQEILPLLRSLNAKQKQVFYTVREWCLKKIAAKKAEPLHVFVTGGAGTGKRKKPSH
ncbi:uncharacterized protein LOC133186474 [Saccostrea echinata]|uniref:uncharacterized protein LOC133186474 n=1 Tax=Saccostrea echinata TaxID=191078 RepID=UPI002A83CD04|nr:uncharacterized protein LOC133186474 [Saccostrea echinata]